MIAHIVRLELPHNLYFQNDFVNPLLYVDNMGLRELVTEHYDDDFKYIAGSRGNSLRVAILIELEQSDEPLTKQQLSDVFSPESDNWAWAVSDLTIERTICDDRGLIDRGWVRDMSSREGSANRYTLTPRGSIVLDALRELFLSFDVSAQAGQELNLFLDTIADSEHDADKAVVENLADAEVLQAAEWDFSELRLEADQFITRSQTIRGMSEIFATAYIYHYYEYTVERGKQAELILAPHVVERIENKYADEFREILESGNLTIYRGPDEIEFNWTITDHGVAWGIFEDQRHAAELLSESDVVREWALDIYESYKNRSEDITSKQLEQL